VVLELQSRQIRYRLEIKRSLPCDCGPEQTERILLAFDHACALTHSAEHVTMDHFIPIEWGHGGTYPGNVYPLDQQLNKNKSNKNPFKWIKAVRRDRAMRKGQHVDAAWNQLVTYLATENGLSVNEFKEFVYWCEQNKRTLQQVKEDNRRSVELWKESRKE
jgi:hypothetical protein